MKYGRDEGLESGRIPVFKKWNNSTEAERRVSTFLLLHASGSSYVFSSNTKFVWLLFWNFIPGENLHSVGNAGMTRNGEGRRVRLTLEIFCLNGTRTGISFWDRPVFLKTERSQVRD
jgi:hypothetical protein